MSRFKNMALGTALVAAVFLGWVLSRTASADDCGSAGCSPNADLAFDTEDLDFILEQIKIAERHAAGEELLDILPNASIPWGLRTVDGSFNNLIPGQEDFGAADQEFLTGVDREFREAQGGTSYDSHETVIDSTARLISHLIVNQSVDNPVAVSAAAAEGGVNIGPDIAGADQFFIPNTAPDEGLSAPFNTFMTFFGQFFDHGLDLVNKGGNGVVMMPLQEDDPLFDAGLDGIPGNEDDGPNFMLMPRATQLPGPDGIQGTEDDVHIFINATTPHVDQQQTYASHASSQVLLRHYEFRNSTTGVPCTGGDVGCQLQATGRMLNGFGIDRMLDTADDGGMATWDTAQAQGLLKLGLDLDDQDGNNVPMILADPYGKFIPGPLRGLPQIVTPIAAGPDGILGDDPSTDLVDEGADDDLTLFGALVEGNVASPVDATLALRVNQSFFLDVAHSANPGGGDPDPDDVINPRIDMLSGQVTRGIRESADPGFYDDELLGAHFICGDGRCNENIALTTIHTIFHHEHNRLTNVTKRVLLDAGDLETLNEWLDTPVAEFPSWLGLTFPVSDASLNHQAETQMEIDALNLDWNGERVFQAARFGTEMQYNRIVFDEFAPTLAGLKDVFEGFHTNVDPSITAEFSQSVYRFGHSMLTQTVDRYDADFNKITETFSGDDAQLGLFEAFLNPLALYNAGDDGLAVLSPEEATGAVVRGLTRATANEIDEFVTGAMQNNLVGLPLDIGAINVARGRDVGNPPLNAARAMFFAETQDTRLKPYKHWADYADNLRHEASLVNFIAAYGTHPSLAGADGIVGNVDDPTTTYAGRRAAACAIVGALTADATAYCVSNGFADFDVLTDPPEPAETPADAMAFMFSTIYAGLDETIGTEDDVDWESVDGRTITGLDDVDFWNGGLAEERMPFGGYLGSTHNYIFETQIEDLQNGDRFYYVARTATIHLFSELESNSFTALAMRSTDLGEEGAGTLSLNIFSVPNHILEVDQSQQFDAAGDGTTADPEGDAELTPLVIRDADLATTNIYIADATRFIQYTGGDHVAIGGTYGDDTIIGGIGDDTIIGGAGNDRLEGGDGADHIEGGAGDDIITDLSGEDVIEGGAGNDAISSGNSDDVIFGDAGNDFIVNSSEFGEIFGGLGDDYILDGVHNGHIRGGAGDDWMENLGGGEDLFQGDNGAAPEAGEPAIKGNDVLIIYGGNTDADMENGNDIIVDGPGIDRAEGQLGFDWISFQNDTFGVNIDLDLTIFTRPQLPPSNDTVQNRYDRIEGISGSPLADILRGTSNTPDANDGNELTEDALNCTGDRLLNCIEGLGDLVPADRRSLLPPDFITGDEQGLGFTGGEIILGGAGSDLMFGEGGDDIIDGDASLKVMISTPDPAIRSGPLGQALLAAKSAAKSAQSQVDLDAAAVLAATELQTAAATAVAAADAVLLAANDAVTAANVAQSGLSALTIKDAIGNLISAAVGGANPSDLAVGGESASIAAAWQDFLDSCAAALGFDGASADSTAAEALAAQAAAVAAAADVTTLALTEAAEASALLVAPAATALAAAQTALDAADVMILVPGMRDIMDAVFGGFINPGELSISRVISDDLEPAGVATDSAAFSGNLADYMCTSAGELLPVLCDVPGLNDFGGFIEVTDTRTGPFTDGVDLVRNVERLVFSDVTVVLVVGGGAFNSPATGQPAILGTPDVGETLTASIGTVMDADNISTGGVVDPATVAWAWQSELDPFSGIFTPIVQVNGAGDDFEVVGESIVLTDAESGLLVKVKGTFQDEDLVIEIVESEPVTVSGVVDPGAARRLSIRSATFRPGQNRLRVAGNAEGPGAEIGDFVRLYVPGTTDDGMVCIGAMPTNLVIDVDTEFAFNQRNLLADPVEVCVESDNGLAVSAFTTAP